MFNILCKFEWPSKEDNNKQHDYYNKNWSLTENKSFEIQVARGGGPYHLIGFEFGFNPWRDHGGVQLEFMLANFWIVFTIYDHRHWDYDNNKWEEYHHEFEEEYKEEYGVPGE